MQDNVQKTPIIITVTKNGSALSTFTQKLKLFNTILLTTILCAHIVDLAKKAQNDVKTLKWLFKNTDEEN